VEYRSGIQTGDGKEAGERARDSSHVERLISTDRSEQQWRKQHAACGNACLTLCQRPGGMGPEGIIVEIVGSFRVPDVMKTACRPDRGGYYNKNTS
jgi:hypothetical protein